MSTRTSAADLNLLSCSANVWGLNEGGPNALTLSGQPVPLDDALVTPDPQAYSSILKVCDGSHDLRLSSPNNGVLQIQQGRENALDINNRVERVQVYAEFGFGGGSGDNVLTVKGGSRDIKLWGPIYSRGLNADYVQDAWSDQCADLCSGIDLSGLTRADGQPVTIVLGRFGSKVDRYPASYRVLFWKSLGYRLYWLGKRAAVALHLLG